MMKPRLLIFCPVYTSLIQKDVNLFAQDYEIKIFDLHADQKLLLPWHFIRQLFFLLQNIGRTEIMLSRFVGYQTILPVIFSKLTRKPIVCIMGGLECYSFPSIKLGSYQRPLMGTITKWCLRNASHLCPVHDSLVLSDYTYQDEDYPKTGYLYFVPDCTTPYTVIRNGFDANAWRRSAEKIPNSFITVAHGLESDNIYRLKGVDLIMAIAGEFPQCTFTIVGGNKALPANRSVPNVIFTGKIKNESLHEMLSTQEFYLQLSIIEGFPNALCEAMLCECIPIGSDVAAIPEIIGNDNLILKRRDAEKLKKLVAYALTIDKRAEAMKARNRIKENYTLEKRRNSFMNLFHRLVGSASV